MPGQLDEKCAVALELVEPGCLNRGSEAHPMEHDEIRSRTNRQNSQPNRGGGQFYTFLLRFEVVTGE